jgi:hypothetical protein
VLHLTWDTPYINEVLIPAVISNRGLPGCKNKSAILFWDNCPAHWSGEALGKLDTCGILVIAYPPHSLHIFQVLDVLLFGILKKAKKYQRRDDTLRREVDHVLRWFRADEQATASTTIRASRLKTGLDYTLRDAAIYLIVNETKIHQCDAFREVWLFNYHPPRTSKKRAAQRWGWLNEHLLRKTEKRFINKWSTSIWRDGIPESWCDADDSVTTWLRSRSSKSAEDTKLPKLGMDQFILRVYWPAISR